MRIYRSGDFLEGDDPVNSVIAEDLLEVLPRIPADTFDLVFADPPYNLQLENDLYRPNRTKVDAVDDDWDQFDSFEAYDVFTERWLSEVRRVMKPSATLWVIGSYHNIFRIGRILQDLGYWILNDVIWIKSNPMPNFRGVRFTNATETLIWAVKDKSVKDYTFNYELMKDHNGGKQMRSDWTFALCRGHERLRDDGEKVHSTQKPLDLLERVVLSSSQVGDLVLDPFAGTGTTAHAAMAHGRNFCMIEINDYYADWIVRRLEQVRSES